MSLQYVPDLIYDAGKTRYEELVISLTSTMKDLNKGNILEIISTEPGLKEKLPSWCRIQTHLLLERKDFGESSYYYIEKR
ncbi:sulfurtransferase TusA family protein [Neobacillus sp. DY30]|uniref:sulfurtransferase TusA family protein n=1 Tax=Neobacillus sp. DY30 TaxID=3047871 RepID=UPI0024C0D70B|nr:sulfurtransferase TusA family protein [Neobacillus sp. DY30]WHX99711.1 sulfurtransferase TusA family protein [Neobacillus sp. DY30]